MVLTLTLPALPTDPLVRLASLAVAASTALLLGALAFQYIGGFRPCELCHWQRYAHVVVVLFGLGAVFGRGQWKAVAFGLTLAALVTSSGLALYHVGVEWKWWLGPQSCTGSIPRGLSVEALKELLMRTPVVRCDEIPWSLFGLSMAGWNFLASLALAIALAVGALRRPEPSA